MTIFVIAAGSVLGVAAEGYAALENQKLVTAASDLHDMSLDELTAIYNTATGKSVGKFKCSKSEAADKVMAALTAKTDWATIGEVKTETDDKTSTVTSGTGDNADEAAKQTAAEKKAVKEAEAKKPRRESMLQRMARAFKEVKGDDGKNKRFTIEELRNLANETRTPEEIADGKGCTDDRVHQYISILKNPKDRFVMNIAKTAEKTYYLVEPRA